MRVLEGVGSVGEAYGDAVYELLRLSRILIAIIDGKMALPLAYEGLKLFRTLSSSKSVGWPWLLLSAVVLQTVHFERLDTLGRFGAAPLAPGPQV